jgi:hypothetical protein
MASKPTKSTKSAKTALAAVPKDDVQTPVAKPQIAIVADAATHDSDAAPKGDPLKMKELLAAVVTKTGAKKKDAKDVVDAVLAEIAAALSAGKPLSLPPLGHMRVAKTQDKGGAVMMVLKLRMGTVGGAKDTLADEGEDS